MRNLTCITLFALSTGACATYQFTELDETQARPARSPAEVVVFMTAPADQTYREVGVIEADASSFAEARKHFQALGGENGCDAVKAFDNRTSVIGAGGTTVSTTTYVGSCLVRTESAKAHAGFDDTAKPQAVNAVEASNGEQPSHH